MSVVALEIVVTTYAGEAIPEPMVCRLEGRAAVSIGRNPSNDLVLDDPARQVSRFQAKLKGTSTGAELSNVSSQSCVLVNGEEIKPGEKAKLVAGDSIVMGRYLLALRKAEVDEALESSVSEKNTALDEIQISEGPGFLDESIQQIPDDYDVFAIPANQLNESVDLEVESLSDFASGQNQALLQDLQPLQAVGMQNLLEQQAEVKGAVLDLLEEKRDPLQLLGSDLVEAVSETKALDHGSEIERIIRLPSIEAVEDKQPVKLIETNKVEKVRHQTKPQAEDVDPLDLTTNSAKAVDVVKKTKTAPQVLDALSRSTAEDKSQHKLDSLKQALAEGCGMPVDTLPEVNEELMVELGSILKALCEGTVRLMHSRSLTKHEMRANVTIIASAGNNPIKFAPDGGAALQQMLGKRFSGFMPPIEAIEDAFDDLAAHQLGLLAGARSASAEFVEKLNPEITATKHDEKSFLEGLFPALKEAKLWRKHKARYKEIADDKEGFARIVEKSFVKSYEEEIERVYIGRSQ